MAYTQLIKEWAIARELDKQDAKKQVIKLAEEHGELAGALLRGDMAEVKDAIGDMYVVLTILCMQLDLDIETCIQEAYEVIKDRTGKTVNGVFIKQEDL
jgi:NTP pyrophosphatase (non-canonical NTP hydrolase)